LRVRVDLVDMDTRRALLDALGDGPVSGPALADDLGVSRAAVWKAVESLREEGFAVESTPEGYVAPSAPATPPPALSSDSTRPTRSSITTDSRRPTTAPANWRGRSRRGRGRRRRADR